MVTRVRWNPDLHPRGPLGRFIDTSGLAGGYRHREEQFSDYRQYHGGAFTSGRDLEPEEIEAVTEYGQDSWSINTRLRSGEIDSLHPTVNMLDFAAEARTTTEDLTLHRGVRWADLEALGMEPGDQIVDRAFMSTSMSPDVASGFGAGTRIEIDVPAGTPAMEVSRYIEQEEQLELALPRGAVIEIVEMPERSWGQRVIRARLVGFMVEED